MQPAARDDRTLVTETLDGNQLSFQLLIERYQDRLFGLVRHFTKSAVEIVGDGTPQTGAHLASPESNLEREEIAEITKTVLDELPEIFRTVLVLREFEDLSYQEMAEVLSISIGTV